MRKDRFNTSEIITPVKFMKISDIIYSGILPNEEFKQLYPGKYRKVYSNNGLTTFKILKFEIKENSIIFCHALFIDALFEHLNPITEFQNIKLITSQSDIAIDKKMYLTKPKCISEWYSTNVNHKDDKLIPIPLGIVDNMNKKNLSAENFTNEYENTGRLEKIYVNYNLNTNYFHRYQATKNVLKSKFFYLEKPNNSLDHYSKQLKTFKLTLTPWGNGIDTHRLWEALYMGCIPITKNHINYRNFKKLPIVFIDKYKDLKKIKVSNIDLNFENIDELKFSWWTSKIRQNTIKSSNKTLLIDESSEKIT